MEESLRHPENPILETKKYLRQSLTDHAGTGHNSSVEPRRWVWRTWDHNSQHLQILSYSVGLQITHKVDAGTALQADSIRKAW